MTSDQPKGLHFSFGKETKLLPPALPRDTLRNISTAFPQLPQIMRYSPLRQVQQSGVLSVATFPRSYFFHGQLKNNQRGYIALFSAVSGNCCHFAPDPFWVGEQRILSFKQWMASNSQRIRIAKWNLRMYAECGTTYTVQMSTTKILNKSWQPRGAHLETALHTFIVRVQDRKRAYSVGH